MQIVTEKCCRKAAKRRPGSAVRQNQKRRDRRRARGAATLSSPMTGWEDLAHQRGPSCVVAPRGRADFFAACSSACESAWFGARRSVVQIHARRPIKHPGRGDDRRYFVLKTPRLLSNSSRPCLSSNDGGDIGYFGRRGRAICNRGFKSHHRFASSDVAEQHRYRCVPHSNQTRAVVEISVPSRSARPRVQIPPPPARVA